LPLEADIARTCRLVRFGPQADNQDCYAMRLIGFGGGSNWSTSSE
jgi:hypothetical protein